MNLFNKLIVQQLASLEPWLYGWIISVAVGCAGEVISVIREYKEAREEWHKARVRGSLSFPAKPFKKWLVFDSVAVPIVVIGIAGELYIDFRSNGIETQLRNANGQLALLLEEEAGEASASAANAKTDSQTALTNAAGAKIESDAAKQKADSAKKEVGNVEERAVAVAKQLDTLQLLISSRTISNLPAFRKAAETIAGMKIRVSSYPNDLESYFPLYRY